MSNTLLPCPFCGGEAILESNKLRYGTIYSAYCQKCGAEIIGFSEQEAISTWNRRAHPERCEIAEYAEGCDECGFCAKSENKPLTLDELHEIDNELLYFHCTVGHWSLNGWHIVKPINYDGVGFKDLQLDNDENNVISAFNCGITWVAYKQKPEVTE